MIPLTRIFHIYTWYSPINWCYCSKGEMKCVRDIIQKESIVLELNCVGCFTQSAHDIQYYLGKEQPLCQF